jgi:hypothetical protein
MTRVLSGTAFIVAITIAAPGWSAVTFQPLGGPYYPESAPSPPSTIFEPLPSYYPPAMMYSYPYGYRDYRRHYNYR